MSKAVALDNWRNFVSFAPDLTIDALQNETTFVNLWPYMRQGAKERETNLPDPDILDRLDAQRGWLLQHIAVNKPLHGVLVDLDNAYGFQYRSEPGYEGADCFNYVFSNGSQFSNVGRILINVIKNYSGNIIVQRKKNTNSFRYVAQYTIPTGAQQPQVVMYKWIEQRPVKIYTDKPRVYIQQNIVAQTVYDPVTNQTTYQAESTPWLDYTWPDQNLTPAFDGDSTNPYIQPDGPYPMVLEIQFLSGKLIGPTGTVTWQFNKTISVDVRTLYGTTTWWSGGHVVLVNA